MAGRLPLRAPLWLFSPLRKNLEAPPPSPVGVSNSGGSRWTLKQGRPWQVGMEVGGGPAVLWRAHLQKHVLGPLRLEGESLSRGSTAMGLPLRWTEMGHWTLSPRPRPGRQHGQENLTECAGAPQPSPEGRGLSQDPRAHQTGPALRPRPMQQLFSQAINCPPQPPPGACPSEDHSPGAGALVSI